MWQWKQGHSVCWEKGNGEDGITKFPAISLFDSKPLLHKQGWAKISFSLAICLSLPSNLWPIWESQKCPKWKGSRLWCTTVMHVLVSGQNVGHDKRQAVKKKLIHLILNVKETGKENWMHWSVSKTFFFYTKHLLRCLNIYENEFKCNKKYPPHLYPGAMFYVWWKSGWILGSISKSCPFT